MNGRSGQLSPRQLEALRARARPDALRAGPAAQARTAGQTLDDGRREQLFPASYTQTRMWLLEQWPETGTLHHAVRRWQLEGALDTVALQAALDALITRHEALRTGFAEHDGEPRQRLLSSAHCPIEFIPHDQLDAHAHRPFDLTQPPLLRVALSTASAASAPERHTLQIVLHHIVSDGWSVSVLNRELAQLYADALHHRPSALPELPLQYPDFALWQRQALTGPAFDRLLDFWRHALDDLPTLALPTDHPRPARADHRGARLPITVDAALTRDLHALARQHGCTLYMVLLAAFQLLLARYCAQRDVVVGTPVAGRSHPSLDPLIGFFANTLVLRADVDPALSVPRLLERVRAASLAAFDHADMPFEKLVEALRPVRDPARNPLFQVMFALRNMPAGELALEGADARALPLDSGLSQFDLTLELSERDGALEGVFEYASALFEPATIERMAGHYATLLRAFARHQDRTVGTLPLLTDAERALIVERWNDTAVPRNPADTLVSLFEQQVARSPHATALVHAGSTLGYDALNRRANRLAHRLRALGVRPGAVVGVQLDTSPDWAVALIGIMKAGAICLPMDIALPAARVRWMLDDADAVLCIAQQPDGRDLGRPLLRPDDAALAGEPESDPRPDIDGGSAACVLYTSGSTGEPKGVLLEHGALCNRMLWLGSTFGLGTDDAMLTQASPGFDVSVGQLFAPLLHGGRCVLVDAARRADSSALLTLTRAHGVTLWDVTPAMLHLLVDETDFPLCGTLRHVFCGGEAMDAELGRRFAARSQARLHNLYGPTEAAIDTTWWTWQNGSGDLPTDAPAEAPPIGRPIANAQVRVLDAENQPVPVGVEGELFIGGAGLARGYLKRPELSAERFVPDPFSRVPGARLYRTGDRVRWRADGSLSFAGRQDRQIKLRGFRIEPGEIEAALDALPGVRQAAVMPDGNGRLIAWAAGDGLDAAALRSALARTLPDYMLPSSIVLLPQLPLTLNGKVDRDALPRPARDVAGEGRSAARSPRQQALAELWADVLERPAVGADDSFFELGGHSLLAARLASRIRQLFGVDLPLRAVFDAPTVSAMDALLQSLRSDGRPQPAAPQRMAHGDELPCAFAQSRLWFVERWGASAGLYHVVSRWQIEGALDTVALQAALDALIARHEALRTGFAEHDGEPRQRLLSSAHCPIEFIPHDQLDAHAHRPFDLTQPPLLRVALSTASAPERHTLQIVLHHIVSDGWSVSVLNRELAQLYADALHHRPSALPELPLQYPDFALWQRQALTGPAFDRLLDFWRHALDDLPTLALPTDHPRPARADHRGARLPITVDAALTRDLHALARQHGCTLYMVLLAAFQLLLARYCAQRDVVVGTPVAGRSHPSLDPLIGFFANTLVLRADVDPALSVPRLLERVRATSLAAFDHADMPFEKLVEALRPVRDPARNPLFQVMFALQNAPADTLALSGVKVSAEDTPHVHAKFDLMLDLAERDDAIEGVFEYASALFEPATIERMAGHYATLLRAFARHQDRTVGTLPLLTDAERALIVERWNDTAVPRNPADTLVSLFEQQVARSPHATALVHAGTILGYDALNRRANRLAHRLRALGVGPDIVVAVRMQRSVDLVVAILATQKAGGAWLPIDPDYPASRAQFMCDDASAPVLLTQRALKSDFDAGSAHVLCLDDTAAPADGPDHDPPPLAGPDHLAYVIYTSGSTGRPKGVMVSHAAICNHMHWMRSEFGFAADDRILLKTGISADASVWELLAPLLCGGQLVLADEGIPRDPALLVRQVERDRITVMQAVPSLLRALVEEHGFTGAPSLRQMFCGGEALAPDLVRRFLTGSGARLHNLYGPTEAAIDATWWTCSRDDDEIPIGRPIANMRAHVLDGCMQPVPVGVAGELYLGGIGLARAYLGRPELTAERFVADPFSSDPGARLYRTGDRVRRRADGSLLFLQRTDHQIKLRGFRIEPGEIEAALTADPSVAEAVVVLREDRPGDPRLVAYVRGRDGRPDTAALRQSLTQTLPAHMLPSAVLALDRMPRTPHGKLDRDALPAPDFAASQGVATGSRSPVEAMLCELWADVLALPQAGPHDHFFDLGGHSLLAVRLVSRIGRLFNIHLPLSTLFEAPTPAELAPRLQSLRQVLPAETTVVVTASSDAGQAPCTPAQAALWFIERWSERPGLYHIVERWNLPEGWDADTLQRALDALVARHPSLRTGFIEIDGEPVQRIDASARCPLERISPDDADAHAQRAFALDQPPLARAALWPGPDGRTILQWVVHHLVSDGWSQSVLRRDLSALYDGERAGRPASLSPLRLSCADHAARLQARLAGPRGAQLLDYWRSALADLPVLDLPTDRPRPAQPDYAGASVECMLDAALTARLRALARSSGCTLYMVLLAAWALLLARWSRQDDVAIGTPVAGRDQGEFDGVAGLFVNTLVMRIAAAADQPLPALLADVRSRVLAAFDHADQPFEGLVRALQPTRERGRNPLFQTLFVLQPADDLRLQLGGHPADALPVSRPIAKFDLTLEVREAGQALQMSIEYACALFDHDTVARMAGHLCTLLHAFADHGDRAVATLPLLTAGELQALHAFNESATGYPADATLASLFEQVVARRPHAVALTGDGHTLSYGELNARANRIAHRLRALGAGPDRCVGLCMKRSLDQAVALLGIVKAGAAYLPVDPDYPAARIDYMLRDASVTVVLAAHDAPALDGVQRLQLDDAGIAAAPADNPPPAGDGRSLAYVLYTSGSTGQPKGVMVEQRSVVRLVRDTAYAKLDADETFLLLAPPTFDAATFELWGALLNGARCVVHPEAVPTAAGLEAVIREQGVSTLWLTAALFNTLIDERPEALRGLRQLLTGGEALSVPHVRRAQAALPGVVLINGYGPTEGTTFTCCHTIASPLPEDCTAVPIGRPIANTTVHVLDAAMQPVPVGVEGELWIGGAGVARGYLGRPDLSAERFVPDPWSAEPGARLYRSGDRVRWRADGTLDFIGRNDEQIKLRGFRIEPGEIEAALAALPGVQQAAVMLRTTPAGERRLLAWVAGEALDGAALRSRLAAQLPTYMLPSAVIALERFPLTANGKLDRARLPDPAAASGGTAGARPRDAAERHLLAIWESLFGRDGLSVEDDFFAIGGHSLLAVRMADAIERSFGQRLPLDTFWFRARTVRTIAGLLRDASGRVRWPLRVPIRAGGSRPPLFCVHTIGGNLFHYFELARALPDDQPVIGLNAVGVGGGEPARTSVEAIAADCIAAMREQQPHGPYRIAGFSSGGTVAFEMAQQLRAAGEDIAFLGLLDTWAPGVYRRPAGSGLIGRLRARLRPLLQRDRITHALLHALGLKPPGGFPDGASAHWWAHWSYRPRMYPGRVDLYIADVSRLEASDPLLGWSRRVGGNLTLHSVSGSHGLMMKPPHVDALAALIRQRLEEDMAGEAHGV
jgi:amino acid adenylation domain-containing protein